MKESNLNFCGVNYKILNPKLVGYFYKAINARIEERRDTLLVSLIHYLQNSQTALTKYSNQLVPLATKMRILNLSGQILSILYKK